MRGALPELQERRTGCPLEVAEVERCRGAVGARRAPPARQYADDDPDCDHRPERLPVTLMTERRARVTPILRTPRATAIVDSWAPREDLSDDPLP